MQITLSMLSLMLKLMKTICFFPILLIFLFQTLLKDPQIKNIMDSFKSSLLSQFVMECVIGGVMHMLIVIVS
jgi:hypothetical protein